MALSDAAGDEELQAAINVTPLVDVVLVLLVVLMVMTPLLSGELPVEIPVAASAETSPARASPVLALAADGSATFEGQVLPVDEIDARLRAAYAGRPDRSIMLAADGGLPYARVVGVMDACRAAGIERIGIVTRPAPAGPGA